MTQEEFSKILSLQKWFEYTHSEYVEYTFSDGPIGTASFKEFIESSCNCAGLAYARWEMEEDKYVEIDWE